MDLRSIYAAMNRNHAQPNAKVPNQQRQQKLNFVRTLGAKWKTTASYPNTMFVKPFDSLWLRNTKRDLFIRFGCTAFGIMHATAGTATAPTWASAVPLPPLCQIAISTDCIDLTLAVVRYGAMAGGGACGERRKHV